MGYRPVSVTPTPTPASAAEPPRPPGRRCDQAAFRALWLAGLASNSGTGGRPSARSGCWSTQPDAATLVALVQTASKLPVLLLALPAGALADTFDRRRLLIAVQVFQAVRRRGC